MPSAFELLGLDYSAMCELGGWFIAVISGSICLGLILYDGLNVLFDLCCCIMHFIFMLLKKRISPDTVLQMFGIKKHKEKGQDT